MHETRNVYLSKHEFFRSLWFIPVLISHAKCGRKTLYYSSFQFGISKTRSTKVNSPGNFSYFLPLSFSCQSNSFIIFHQVLWNLMRYLLLVSLWFKHQNWYFGFNIYAQRKLYILACRKMLRNCFMYFITKFQPKIYMKKWNYKQYLGMI